MTFYERFEELRKQKGISQGKLEKELGFSNGSVSKWKTSTPTHERLQKLANYFNVSVDYLVNGSESEADGYYLDPDVKEYADFLKNNPEHKILFDASMKVSKEDMQKALKAIGIFTDDE